MVFSCCSCYSINVYILIKRYVLRAHAIKVHNMYRILNTNWLKTICSYNTCLAWVSLLNNLQMNLLVFLPYFILTPLFVTGWLFILQTDILIQFFHLMSFHFVWMSFSQSLKCDNFIMCLSGVIILLIWLAIA